MQKKERFPTEFIVPNFKNDKQFKKPNDNLESKLDKESPKF